MAADLACDKFWVNKTMYHDAEKKYYENLAKLQRNGESCVEALGENKEEMNNKKLRDTKKPVIKNHKNMPKQLDVDALRKELMNLEAKNAKNEKFNIKCNTNKINSFEIIQRNEDYDLAKNERLVNSEKKVKQKEVKEKKSKSEKKCKKTKEKEDDPPGGVGMAKLNPETFPKTSLAGEVAKARQHIKSSLECMDQSWNGMGGVANVRFTALLEKMGTAIENLTKRVEILEQKCASCTHPSTVQICPAKPKTPAPSKPAKDDEDDDVDLFGSESEEEDEESKKIREQRLAEYAAKKSKKPALVAKSNIILDIKPWDDETDMKEMEKAVRGIQMDGLVWGASKLVPVAFKIFKLQISCVIEDDKVSVDLLTETLEGIEDYIQSVDIAAFNKV